VPVGSREPLCDTERPIALAVGGGGARGIAHIGVFKVLLEERVPIDMMVGTSVGAFAVALFGLDPDWRKWRDVAFDYLARRGFAKMGKNLVNPRAEKKPGLLSQAGLYLAKSLALQFLAATNRGLFSSERMRQIVDGICPDLTFEDARIPTAIVAFDIVRGEEVVFRTGRLRPAIRASANLIGFFRPMRSGGMLLVDPSPVSSVPVDISRELGAAAVIGVDIRSRVTPQADIPSTADAILRLAAMACERANDEQIARADIVIAPGVGETYWSDFRDLGAHVAEGERAARAALPGIRGMLERLGRT